MYVVVSSPVCVTTRLLAFLTHALSLQAVTSLHHHGGTSLDVKVSNTPTTRLFRPGQHSVISFPPSLWAGHRSDNTISFKTGFATEH